MKKHTAGSFALAAAALLLAQLAPLHAEAAPKPLKVFILAGQSNMDGQANVSTIDFLGEDKENGYLLKKFKPDGKTLVKRATSNQGYHYYGEGRFFILLGKAMAEAMQELMGKGNHHESP